MLQDKIDGLIMTARKENKKDDVLVYQAIKAEFTKHKTAKNAKPLDDNAEIRILQKMAKERHESADIYAKSRRHDLADKESYEAVLLESMLPKAPTAEDYRNVIKEYMTTLDGQPLTKRLMGKCIAFVNGKLTAVDNKALSEIIKEYISE